MSNCNCNCDLLLWKNPVKTAQVFGAALTILLLLKSVNIVNLFFRVAYLALFATGVTEYATKLATGQGLVTKYANQYIPANLSASLEVALANLSKNLSQHEAKIRNIVFANSIGCTLKAAGASYVAFKITSWFSLWTLSFVALNAAFTGPIIYKTYQKEIDAAVGQATTVAKAKQDEYTKLANEKLGPVCKKLETALGPVAKIVKSKLPQNRTAGSTVKAPVAPVEKPVAKASGFEASEPAFPSVPKTEPVKAHVEAAAEAAEAKVEDVKENIKEAL